MVLILKLHFHSVKKNSLIIFVLYFKYFQIHMEFEILEKILHSFHQDSLNSNILSVL